MNENNSELLLKMVNDQISGSIRHWWLSSWDRSDMTGFCCAEDGLRLECVHKIETTDCTLNRKCKQSSFLVFLGLTFLPLGQVRLSVHLGRFAREHLEESSGRFVVNKSNARIPRHQNRMRRLPVERERHHPGLPHVSDPVLVLFSTVGTGDSHGANGQQPHGQFGRRRYWEGATEFAEALLQVQVTRGLTGDLKGGRQPGQQG
jgi:hypothetical protein